ncbi:uncharacterized protein [Triticum aestivum]|uniref:uncharacterized protein n=1 Tax=Triticum aestivum TaxID=4565 RepID=UPI001D01E5AF|nr:uncharacterized protein LOC123150265 [Triticum aestivum]
MAEDFPMAPVDCLPIFEDAACSAAAPVPKSKGVGDSLVQSAGGGGGGGSRCGILGDVGIPAIQIYGSSRVEQTRVGGGGGSVSDINESEGDNVDAISPGLKEGGEPYPVDSVVAKQADSSCGASAHSTGKIDPQAPGWTRRVRVGQQAPDRAPCPDRVCALEQTIRGYAEKLGPNVIEPEIGLTFDSLGEAYDFYNIYSWELGFGIRYGKSRLNSEKTKCMQEVVCGCSGKPLKENSMSCRCECPAMIRLLRTDDNGWYITEHRVEHNHSLSSILVHGHGHGHNQTTMGASGGVE